MTDLLNSNIVKGSEYNSSNPTSSNLAVILCTKNSGSTIERTLWNIKQSYLKPDIIVVDGFSTDDTVKISKNVGGVKIIQQSLKKFPGKGVAMKTGLNEVINGNINSNNQGNAYKAILFLDSDIKNITPEWVDDLSRPVLEGGFDMTRGFYQRHPRDAAVTKLIAKPMLRIFFPELSHIEQPLSGEVCSNIALWKKLLKNNPPDGWGIDIWFLIETILSGYRIKEVYLGNKEHSSLDEYKDDVAILSKMAEQVTFTIIKEAVKYQRFNFYKDIET
ncbi:MAG: glycosyltransferase [Deltaproteobacteria bacterium]|nr:glycosyltransferase [Nitrososphaeraceae archaeon]